MIVFSSQGLLLWHLASLLGGGVFLGCGVGLLIFSPSPLTNATFWFFLITLPSVVGLFSGRTLAVGRLWGRGLVTLMGLRLKAVRQSACLSVGQQGFIYLSGCRIAYWIVGSRGLPACNLSPSYHPTHNCHINSFSDIVLILLNFGSNTFDDWVPIPSRNACFA